jgi:diguanylate cyclase (GGDEF)-like protein
MVKKAPKVDESGDSTLVTSAAEVDEDEAFKESCLVVIYGADLGKKFKLEARTALIGRAGTCEIHLDQEEISRTHCKVVSANGQVQIYDLESTNGTYVNDQLVSEHVMQDGDLIKIGRTILKFLSGGNVEHAYYEEIYNLSTMDGLTGVHNRRYLLDNLDREISRAQRYRRDLSLIMVDLDHFKRINDIFGHLAGDYVLRQLTSVLKANIRLEDVLARYGGEEFVVILPEVDREGALACAEKLRELTESFEFVFEEARLPVTISAGVAICSPQTANGADLIRLADERLYEAKNRGRNRVCG